MANVIALTIAGAVFCGALAYIRKEKKKGVRCIGCPSAGQCAGKCK